MDVRVLDVVSDAGDSVALLEQSEPGGRVLYVVTIDVAIPTRRRLGGAQRVTYSRCGHDRELVTELFRQARDDFFPLETGN
jgi:hypothetical protein